MAEGERWPCRVTLTMEAGWGRPSSSFPASLANVGVSGPQSHFLLVLIQSPLRKGLKGGDSLWPGLTEVPGRSLWGPEEEQKEQS